jgi:S1-C subfamily serine protease
MGGTPTRGDELVTAGYPGGRLLVRTVGTFDFVGRAGGSNVLVTDLPCEPGCSGSPVLDVDGRVVGVIVGGTALEQTLAIPIDDASTLLAAHGIAS